MKKVIMFFLTLLLPAISFAETYYSLPEIRDMAQQGWHSEYIDAYGRTISVDIDVQVFGKETAPIFKVAYADYPIDESLLEKEAKFRKDIQVISVSVNNPYSSVSSGNMKNTEFRMSIYRSDGKKVDGKDIYGEEFGNKLTVAEACEYLQELLKKFDIPTENYIYDQPCYFDVLCKAEKETRKVVTVPFYSMTFWRQLANLPILTHASAAFLKRGWPNYEPALYFNVRSEHEYQMIIHDIKEVDIITDDIPLCSLDKVIESIEKEIQKGRIQKIFDLNFGYVLYNDPNFFGNSNFDAECYYAVPSWVVNCIYVENPKNEYSFEKKLERDPEINERNVSEYTKIVINAQTGKMLDPFDTSKKGWGNADYMDFIPWENVR